jgi:hypothetical protein
MIKIFEKLRGSITPKSIKISAKEKITFLDQL